MGIIIRRPRLQSYIWENINGAIMADHMICIDVCFEPMDTITTVFAGVIWGRFREALKGGIVDFGEDFNMEIMIVCRRSRLVEMQDDVWKNPDGVCDYLCLDDSLAPTEASMFKMIIMERLVEKFFE